MKSNLNQALTEAIAIHLSKCKPGAMPNICRAIGDANGYRRIEAMIVSMCLRDQIGIGPAIAQIEMELA